jgi:hypothetical protein
MRVVAHRYSEWTDEELSAEELRLRLVYPSVTVPLSPEVDRDMTRLLEVQMALFARWHRNSNESVSIFAPYYPLVVFRASDITVDDFKKGGGGFGK